MFTLLPEDRRGYGQEFRQKLAIEKLNLEVLREGKTGYPTPPVDCNLIASFNGDRESDATLLERFDGRRILHQQLRLTYLDRQTGRPFAERSIRSADTVIIPCEFLREEISAVSQQPEILVVRNGADGNLFKPTSLRERILWRENQRIDPGRILIGHVGKLTRAKGRHLLELIARGLPESCHLYLYTYTDYAPEAWKLQSRTGHNRISIGLDDKDDERRFHPTPYLDLLIMTSLCETASMVAIEALMSGVPVVATNCTSFLSDELRNDGIPAEHLSLIDLPDGITVKTRTELRVDPHDAERIAEEFLSEITKKRPMNYIERSEIANQSRDAKLESSFMLKRFSKIYNFQRDSDGL